jgi:uncharacterized membrane protein YjjP (DUF1212 family)
MSADPLAGITHFLGDLGQALHVSGTPAHDLEKRLITTGEKLGVRVEGFAVLTFLGLTITTPAGERRIEMLRLRPYDYNMARLIALEDLCKEINHPGQLEAYCEKLSQIMQHPAPWSGLPLVAQGFLLSASVAALLRGGWMEMLCGGLIGLLFVAAFLRLNKISGLGPAIPVILCALAAMLAQGLAVLLPQQSPFISAVAGVVLLLPGFMLTVAMSELATQNFLAGTGRLAGAFMLLFLMGAGLVIGTQISLELLPVHVQGTVTPLPGWMIWPAIAALGISLLAVIQAPLSAWYVSAGACLLAWAVYSLVGAALGNIVGAFAGSLAVAATGHLYAYLSGRPAVLVQIPGLITLVPGSMGFRGLHALIEQDNSTGITLITDMVLTGAVLAVGLLLADNLAAWLIARSEARKLATAP